MDGFGWVHLSYIATTPERLWEALTRGELTRAYWYDRRIESEWRVGEPVSFYDGASAVLTDSGTVLEVDASRRLAYSFRCEFDERARALGFSRVGFALEPFEGMVKLTLVHDQLPNEESVAGFREGWSAILSSLKTYLETGRPLPRLRQMEEQGRPRS